MKEPTLKSVTVSRSLTIHATFEPYGWATFVIDDEHGTLSITSDWGNWSHRWGRGTHLGDSPNLSDALSGRIGRDYDYCARKLTAGDTTVFDEDETRAAVRRRILERRRALDIDRDVAREAWEESANEYSNADTFLYRLREFDALAEVLGEEPWFYAQYVDAPRFLVLREFLLPVLHDALAKRAEAA